MANRLHCPECDATVDRLQRSRGVVAAYPCCCWLTPHAAADIVRRWRETQTQSAADAAH